MIEFKDDNTGLSRLVTEKVALLSTAYIHAKEAWLNVEMKRHLNPGEFEMLKSDPVALAWLLENRGFHVDELPDGKCELRRGETLLSAFEFCLKSKFTPSLN